jgi:hypothetical protein
MTTEPSGGAVYSSAMTPFFGEVGVHPFAEPCLLLPPAEALLDEDFADAAPLHGQGLLLVEVDLEAVHRPRAEGQAERLRVRQCGGDDLGPLLGRVGRWSPGATMFLQTVEAVVVEAADPGVNRGPRAPQISGNSGSGVAFGGSLNDACPLDVSHHRSAGLDQTRDGLSLFRRHRTEHNAGGHGAPPKQMPPSTRKSSAG